MEFDCACGYRYLFSFPLIYEISYIPTDENGNDSIAAPPIGADELPPPYTPTAQGGIPMINCKVCQAIISLEGKQHLFVVKCSVCGEATVSFRVVHYISLQNISFYQLIGIYRVSVHYCNHFYTFLLKK